MKSNQFFSGIALVGLAASVTAGSMYVTISAAQQQDAQVGSAEDASASAPESVVVQAGGSLERTLAPDQVIHSRSHAVVLDSEGAFSGRLSGHFSGADITAASGMTVKVIQGGMEVGKAMTDDQGGFRITGLKPGVAAMLSYGENGFLLYGINLVASEDDQPSENEIDIDSAVVSGADLSIVRKIINSKLPDGDLRFKGAVSTDDEEFPVAAGEISTSIVGHRIQLQKDGRLKGSINLMDGRTGLIREIMDLSIFFVREGKIVGRTDVGANGEFYVAGLAPGIHSVVGVGKDGTFALSVEIIGSETEIASLPESPYQTVAVMAALDMNVAPAGAGDFNSGNASGLTGGSVGSSGAPPAGAPPAPAPSGAGGGGATGSGGGSGAGGGAGAGGGGGAFGALLGGAIGAGVGYAVGQDGTPASPGT